MYVLKYQDTNETQFVRVLNENGYFAVKTSNIKYATEFASEAEAVTVKNNLFANNTGTDPSTWTVYYKGGVFDDDETLAKDSVERSVTQRAVKSYIDSSIVPAGPSYPSRSTLSITTNTIGVELNSSVYDLILSDDVTTFNTTLPTGGDAALFGYDARLDIYPPVSGGPFSITIPPAWKQSGPFNTISMNVGDNPYMMILDTLADGNISYALQEMV